jgi:lipoprotein NlpI
MAKRPKKAKRPTDTPSAPQQEISPPAPAARGRRWLNLLPTLAIIAAVFFIYAPVLHGDWLWDDDLDITGNAITQSPTGWWTIWFDPGSQLDYYPIKASVQWVQWHLWGRDPLGYHLTNIGLHIVGSLLVWKLLSKLGLKFAWLGGLIFAVHPVNVESVAWIAELKNTLSLPPLLIAMCAWIDYDARGRRQDYFLALGFFLVAMLCKTAVVMFPVIILLYAWWKRRKISWGDLRASLPFFAVSLLLGWVTLDCESWCAQRHQQPVTAVDIGGLLPRLALGGLSLSSYFLKCFLPIGLMPVYPKWTVNPPSPGQLMPWVFLAGLFAWIWRNRAGWGRHALFGLGFFVINLAPFLGFKEAAYMHFTWVMDHFLYLPIIGLIGLAMAALGQPRLPAPLRRWSVGALALVVLILAWGSRAYAGIFVNQEALWTYTLRHNPDAVPARNNLGLIKVLQGRLPDAMEDFQRAVELDPDYVPALINRGHLRQQMGDNEGAITDLNRALMLNPSSSQACLNRGLARQSIGDFDGAISDLSRFATLLPQDPNADYTRLWVWLMQTRRHQPADADRALSDALAGVWRAGPEDWVTKDALFLLGRLSEADFLAAANSPDKEKDRGQYCEAWFYSGMKRLLAGDKASATQYFHRCLDTGEANFVEYDMARQELRRLEQTP